MLRTDNTHSQPAPPSSGALVSRNEHVRQNTRGDNAEDITGVKILIVERILQLLVTRVLQLLATRVLFAIIVMSRAIQSARVLNFRINLNAILSQIW